MLPIARPGVVGMATHKPSVQVGAKTCISPMATLSKPASSRAISSPAHKVSSRPDCADSPAASASVAPSKSVAIGIRRCPSGASVRPCATASITNRISRLRKPRDRRCAGSGCERATHRPSHSAMPAKAHSWLKKVEVGETVGASSIGRATAGKAASSLASNGHGEVSGGNVDDIGSG